MMAESGRPLSQLLREGVLRNSEPAVFRGLIEDWALASYALDDWARIFEDQKLCFRVGRMQGRKSPEWERCCSEEHLTFSDFVAWQAGGAVMNKASRFAGMSADDNWAYFDYKYMHKVFEEKDSLLKSVDWSPLGFPELDGSNSTMWIGSKGANTPCHYDQYGCNLVAQLLGRKRWLLFPPEESEQLRPTRIPYEESSVYSSLGFSTCHLPSDAGLMNSRCVLVDLEPGEVLYVPPKWWHFVEHLEVSISVNTWVPLDEDKDARVSEALVKWLIGSLSRVIPGDIQSMLNPTENDLPDIPASVLEGYVKTCLNTLQDAPNDRGEPESKRQKRECGATSWEDVARTHKNVLPLASVPYKTIWEKYHTRAIPEKLHLPSTSNYKEVPAELDCDKNNFCRMIIQAFSHPRVINEVKSVLKSQILSNK